MEFQAWPKIARLNRDITITEKIDGTNAAILIEEDGPADFGLTSPAGGALLSVEVDGVAYQVGAQSRKRLLALGADNFGFALWVATHAVELVRALGEGRHFGEWWGHGIQRGYGASKGERVFSLFNTSRYAGVDLDFDDGTALTTVPVLYEGPFSEDGIKLILDDLRDRGSVVADGYEYPEGVVVFHQHSNQMFKVTLENDELPKGLV